MAGADQLVRVGFLILGYLLGVVTVSYMARYAFKEYTNEVYKQYVAKLKELKQEGNTNEQATTE